MKKRLIITFDMINSIALIALSIFIFIGFRRWLPIDLVAIFAFILGIIYFLYGLNKFDRTKISNLSSKLTFATVVLTLLVFLIFRGDPCSESNLYTACFGLALLALFTVGISGILILISLFKSFRSRRGSKVS